jgi:hypothetical protein
MTAAISYNDLADLIGGIGMRDVPCPFCGPDRHHPANRKRRVLRIWHKAPGFATYTCARCGASGFAHAKDEPPGCVRTAKATPAGTIAPAKFNAPSKTSETALAIWAICQPAQGTLVEKYLVSRGITIPIPPTIRFHHGLRYPDGSEWPAMVALVERVGVPVAIHRTYLQPDGRGKAPLQSPKLMLGPCGRGGVRLAEIDDFVCVGEGIETCLSVMQHFTEAPVWAALSAPGMTKLILPKGVKCVTILADRDSAGEAAAIAAGRRWKQAGLAVKIVRPPNGHKDFNDALRDEKEIA